MIVSLFLSLQIQASFLFKDLDWRLKGPLRPGFGLVRMIQKGQLERLRQTLEEPRTERAELLAQAFMAAHLMDAPEAVLYLVQNVREARSLLIEQYVKASLACDARITSRWRPFIAVFGEQESVHARIAAEFERLDLLNQRRTHSAGTLTIFDVPAPGTIASCYQIVQVWPYRYDAFERMRPVNQMSTDHYRAWVAAAERYRAPEVEVSAARP